MAQLIIKFSDQSENNFSDIKKIERTKNLLRAFDAVSKNHVAIKLQMPSDTDYQLNEFRAYSILGAVGNCTGKNTAGFPHIYGYGNIHSKAPRNPTAIVMELLGKDLHSFTNKDFTFTEWLNIGLQILTALFECHDKGIIHGDVKPENIVANLKTDDWPPTFNLVDFEYAHIPEFPLLSRPLGTIFYMSLHAHAFAAWRQSNPAGTPTPIEFLPTPMDDLVSFVIMLVVLIEGQVPWSQDEELFEKFTEIQASVFKLLGKDHGTAVKKAAFACVENIIEKKKEFGRFIQEKFVDDTRKITGELLTELLSENCPNSSEVRHNYLLRWKKELERLQKIEDKEKAGQART